ncbi:sulfite exporter TauE/SafE family protein [Georgenia muralis]|uniref:Probable membrane transporter protein n=1 Tax=Georgenia muralis TaxID=154117 RepID=A0A3N4ZLR7_9MICO|nr:sulfite exporter TauE/SafE family protein [Georgenia muralis]RPF26718.1 hypothetical protein EDD32_1168 [Georgenia muralis]
MLALTIPLGLLVGITLGALGGGGSILTVPALVYLLGQDVRSATTGSLIIVGITTAIGMLPHLRAGRVRLGQGLVFGLLGVAGAYPASLLSVRVDPQVLLVAFAGLLLVVAGLMTQRRRSAARSARSARAGGPVVEARTSPILSLRPLRCDCGRAVVLVLTAAAVGLLTGFFGVGGGFAAVPALVLALRLPMPVAVGTSLVVISVNSVTSLAARLGQDVSLDWAVLGLFTAAAVAGSLLGSRVVTRVRPERLSLAFTVLLVLVALAMAVQSVPRLL